MNRDRERRPRPPRHVPADVLAWRNDVLRRAGCDEYRSRGGDAGPMVRAMAQVPVVLRGYMDLSRSWLVRRIGANHLPGTPVKIS